MRACGNTDARGQGKQDGMMGVRFDSFTASGCNFKTRTQDILMGCQMMQKAVAFGGAMQGSAT